MVFLFKEWFPTGLNPFPLLSPSPGTLTMPGDIFGGQTGVWWGQVGDAAKHPTYIGQRHTTGNQPARNVDTAEVEKSCSERELWKANQ